MADKKVNLIISLKDGVSSGLQGIRNGISNTISAFKKIAISGVGATTAIVGGLTALAKAYAEQESAQNKLKATFDALGESGSYAITRWGAFATSLQKITTVDDEITLGLVSLAKTMGISNDRIEDSIKGAIGLSKAFGLDLQSSMKMVALAGEGQFEMLGRYIPAIRTATTDAQKMAIVNQAMATGFRIAQEETTTISGAFTSLKNAIGDAMQAAGEAIFGKGGLASGIAKVKDKIVEMTEDGTIAKWAEKAKEGLQAVSDTIKIILGGGEGSQKVMEKVSDVVKASFLDAAQGFINLVIKAAPVIGGLIGDAFKAVATSVIKETVQKSQIKGELYRKGQLEKESDKGLLFMSAEERKQNDLIRQRNQARIDEAYNSKIAEEQDKATTNALARLGDNASRTEKAFAELEVAIQKYKKASSPQTGTAKSVLGAGLGNVLNTIPPPPPPANDKKPNPAGGSVGQWWGIQKYYSRDAAVRDRAEYAKQVEYYDMIKGSLVGQTTFAGEQTLGLMKGKLALFDKEIERLSQDPTKQDAISDLVKTNEDQLTYLKIISERVGGIV
jgi:hypothetical protein